MSDKDTIQSSGREANAAKPLNASENKGGAERYPSARRDDSVDVHRVKGPANPTAPKQGAGDG